MLGKEQRVMENVIIGGAGELSPVSWTPCSIQFESGDSDPGARWVLRVYVVSEAPSASVAQGGSVTLG